MLMEGSGADFVVVTLLPDGEEGRPDLKKSLYIIKTVFHNLFWFAAHLLSN